MSCAEHISLGYDKRLLDKNTSYAAALKLKNNPSQDNYHPTPKLISKINQPVLRPVQPNTSIHNNKAAAPSIRTLSSSIQPSSSIEELPDLDDSPSSSPSSNVPLKEKVHIPKVSPSPFRKRGRPSLSPPSRNIRTAVSNRYDILSLDTANQIDVEVHHPPRQLNPKGKKNTKMNISRPL